MSKGKVLVIGSNATRIETKDGRSGATGQYLNETVVPMMALIDAGYDVVLATPGGNKPHMDPASDSAEHFGGDIAAYEKGKAFWENDPSMNSGLTLRQAIDQGLDRFDAIFVPGGQGPVVDLMIDPDMGEIARHFHEKSKPSAFLCHGPMATVAAMPHAREFRSALVAGDQAKAREWAKDWQYAGYRMTVFSDTEEKVVEDYILHAKLYFNMIEALSAAGGKTEKTAVDFEPNVVIDRELITGQNPRSDRPVAKALIEALDRRQAG
jgi:putative intracellular protease/amidase